MEVVLVSIAILAFFTWPIVVFPKIEKNRIKRELRDAEAKAARLRAEEDAVQREAIRLAEKAEAEAEEESKAKAKQAELARTRPKRIQDAQDKLAKRIEMWSKWKAGDGGTYQARINEIRNMRRADMTMNIEDELADLQDKLNEEHSRYLETVDYLENLIKKIEDEAF